MNWLMSRSDPEERICKLENSFREQQKCSWATQRAKRYERERVKRHGKEWEVLMYFELTYRQR